MALRMRKKVLAAKIETTEGTDASPGATDAVLARDIEIMPMEGSDQDRGHDRPALGNAASIPFDLHMKMSFKVELAGSGVAGTAPAWGPLLRACGVAEVITASTSVAYNPISSGFESMTLHLNIDETRYALVGARGSCKIVINASAIPMLEFTFTGLWTKPSAVALPNEDVSDFLKPAMASKVNTPTSTIGGTDHVFRNFALDLGNQVEGRFLIGAENIVIVDKAERLEMQIEATGLGTLDPFELARTQSSVAIALTHGTVAGNIAALSIPAAQMQRPTGITEAQGIKEWPLNLLPLPVSGNDQWTLTLT